MNRRLLLALFVCLTPAFVSTAADWPQWRGPNRDGVSKETGLLKEWPEGGPKLIWQVKDLGDGYSAPAVVGDRLYLMSSKGMDSDSVQARSAPDGKAIWSTSIGGVGPNTPGNNYPGSRSTPTVDGDRVYAIGSDGDVACLEAATGKIVWQRSMRKDFGGKPGLWAYAESPLIDGDALVCTPGGAEATILALNKKTGEVVWKAALSEADAAAYSSIIVVQAAGVKQYVQLLDKGLIGVEAKTGKPLWRYTGIIGGPPIIPTPVSRKEFVYGATSKGGGAVLKLTAGGGGVEAAELFPKSSKLPTAIGGSVEVEGYLYGTTGSTGGSIMCADFATGEIKWQDGSLKAGAMLYADGRLYWHGESSGEVALVEATPEAFRKKGSFTPVDMPATRKSVEAAKDGKAWTYMALADGRLYVRDWNCLWCYDVKDRKLAIIRRR